jgi:hypothetical protein
MYGMLYVLDDRGKPKLTTDVQEWREFFVPERGAAWRVALDEVGEATISTIFIGVDQNYFNFGSPMLWETRVSGGQLDGEVVRYAGLASAKKGHVDTVARAARVGLFTAAVPVNPKVLN